MHRLTQFFSALLLIGSLSTMRAQAQDIVDVAAGAGSFDTLVAAVQAAGLEGALRGDGPFTVFAPTDDAFAALPEGTLDFLLANPDALERVLLYHVVAGEVLAADVVNLTSAETLLGENVSISVNGGVMVNDANVVQTDIMASNGVIHVIDSVLIPPEPQEELDIVDTAVAAGAFDTLVAAVQAAGLEDALRGEGPFTVFAPTDDAFAALPDGTLDALLANPDELRRVLLYHVVAGEALAADVVNLTSAETLLGESVAITVENGSVMVNDANVVQTDVLAANGVIHVIDSVLIPPAQEPNIVEVAADAGRFNTLLAAAQAAGLADVLANGGPFTVFAPNDEAFAKIPAETLNALLNDPAALANILLYHVLPVEYDSNDVLSRRQLKTLQGSFARVSVNANGAFIQNAEILNVDIGAANGIIHEIDSVIIPPSNPGTAYEVTVVNASKRQVLSPPLVVTHSRGLRLFNVGGQASDGLKTLAEDGDAGPLAEAIEFNEAVFQVARFDQPIMPGQSRTIEVRADTGFTQISVAGMLVVTNDAFFAAQTEVPTPLNSAFKNGRESGSETTVHAVAYDAGTEFNSELCAHIPAGPCGSPFSAPAEAGEGYIYVSNGIQGTGDLSPAEWDWRNPVAIVHIRRK